jgi:hypothetical protein
MQTRILGVAIASPEREFVTGDDEPAAADCAVTDYIQRSAPFGGSHGDASSGSIKLG